MLFQRNGRRWLVHAPAKLNLYLEVIGRRNDGFHDLETCMVAVDLYDSLSFRSQPDQLSLSVRSFVGDGIPEDGSNLVLKAADLLRQRTGYTGGAVIELVKRIPVQAGMGGGSSDAAATLLALNRLWQLGLGTARLHEIAAELGSDLSFFIEQTSAAVCRGRGELVEPITSAPRLHFVLAHPGVGLSTADVFRACRIGNRSVGIVDFVSSFHTGRPRLLNRLSESARTLQPEIETLAGHFESVACCHHQMTGSGSAWFGLFATRRRARRCASLMRNRGVPFARAVSMTV